MRRQQRPEASHPQSSSAPTHPQMSPPHSPHFPHRPRSRLPQTHSRPHHRKARPQSQATSRRRSVHSAAKSRTYREPGTYRIVYHPYDQAATRTCCDIFVVLELLPRDFEAVTARTGIVVDALLLVPSHIFDLNFIVVCAHFRRLRHRRRRQRI